MVTAPLALTVVPAPTPPVSVGSSRTSRNAPATPTPSDALPSSTLPYDGAGRSTVGTKPSFRLEVNETAPPEIEPPLAVNAPTVGWSVALTVVAPAVKRPPAATPVPFAFAVAVTIELK